MKRNFFIIFALVISQVNAQTNYNHVRAYYLQGSLGELDVNEGSALNQFLREDALLRPRFQNMSRSAKCSAEIKDDDLI